MTQSVKQFSVFNIDDIKEALSEEEVQTFARFQRKIEASRTLRGLVPKLSFILCAADEPYATLASEIMRQGEAVKQAHEMLAIAGQQINALTMAKGVKPAEPLDLNETHDPDEDEVVDESAVVDLDVEGTVADAGPNKRVV